MLEISSTDLILRQLNSWQLWKRKNTFAAVEAPPPCAHMIIFFWYIADYIGIEAKDLRSTLLVVLALVTRTKELKKYDHWSVHYYARKHTLALSILVNDLRGILEKNRSKLPWTCRTIILAIVNEAKTTVIVNGREYAVGCFAPWGYSLWRRRWCG